MYVVHIGGDSGYDNNRKFFNERHHWAINNCKSYKGMDVEDVTEVSMCFDEVAEYSFDLEQDKLLFVLRWK